MSFPSFFSEIRLFKRIVGVAVLLLTFTATELCSAAEVTFSGNYSLQLPGDWAAKEQEDKSVIGVGPGEVSFQATVYRVNSSPENFMAQTLRLTEKKPGFALIEKISLKTNPDRKAQRVRYEVDGPKGREAFVKYYFQIVEKQVVILIFQLPNFSSKSVKSDIEAIFNSVKVTTPAGQDDSWLTTPAEGSKRDSKATRGQDPKIAGTYVMEEESGNYIVLKADGTFSGQAGGKPLTGTYTRDGATIQVTFSGGRKTATLRLDKESLIDPESKRWVKKQ